ncbi:glycoside hydrolase family 71 protein [Auricularia subglabra TFB-10046 SS5]|nr:glycoside hydrolase family 71 protein [Auricularia subglabra TFB-10046 SS5]
MGVEGFAMNIAHYDYEVDQANTAWQVAEQLGFKLFWSFDLAGGSMSMQQIISLVAAHAKSPASYLWKGKVLVSTFYGENQGPDQWAYMKSQLANQDVQVSFAPAFITYRHANQVNTMLQSFPAVDGFFNWWAWPEDFPSNVTTTDDVAFQNAIRSQRTGPYIMAVSPWQFKNLGSGLDNDWVQNCDQCWDYRWRQAINTVKPDIVEIISWNDYGESHYISGINPKTDLQDAAKYVNGFDHSPWRIMGKHFVQWYKTGSQPAVAQDNVVFWYRSHWKNDQCSQGLRPRNADYVQDAIFVEALLTSQATIAMDIGINNHREFVAPAGATSGWLPFPSSDNEIPYIQIIRNGQVVKAIHGSKFISHNCPVYNFNPWVGIL